MAKNTKARVVVATCQIGKDKIVDGERVRAIQPGETFEIADDAIYNDLIGRNPPAIRDLDAPVPVKKAEPTIEPAEEAPTETTGLE